MTMAQNQRIQEFLKGRLAQMEVAGQQTTVIFGQSSKNADIENYQNEYKCYNQSTVACTSNLHKCTNDKGFCIRSTNTFDCTNKSVE